MSYVRAWRPDPTSRNMRCTKLYRMWVDMRSRCRNNQAYYEDVEVCDSWQDYDTFREWACAQLRGYDGERRRASIDRIDSGGHYEPDNCRLISISENCKRATVARHGAKS